MPKQSKTFEFIRAHPTIQAKEEQNRSFFSSRRNSRSEGTDQSAFFQAKLTINEPGDQYERQADAMANRVMRMPAPLGEEEESLQAKPLPNSTLQRKCAECEEEEQVQRQAVEEEEEPLQTKPLMRKTSEGGYSASPQLASQLNSSKGGGNPLPRPTLATMNQAFGVDFSNVRVHTGSQAEGMSQGIQARAFTHGSDIYFNRGEYSPESLEGKRLLGHELTHVVQQGGGRPVANIQMRRSDGTRRLDSNVSDSIGVGTLATYSLQQIGAEIGPADTVESFRWRVYTSRGGIMTETITQRPQIHLRAAYPDEYNIEVAILINGNPSDRVFSLRQRVFFQESNTELGQLSVGNFDFLFNGISIEVIVKVKFQFEDSITNPEQATFKSKFFRAIRNVWTNSGYSLTGEGECPSSNVPIHINAREVTANYHKLVDVEKDYRRPNVISDMNLYLAIGEQTIAHEFGHVLGLYDEYDGGFFENIMFWHNNSHMADENALMNTGGELRPRYFQHYRDAAQRVAQPGCEYRVTAPAPNP